MSTVHNFQDSLKLSHAHAVAPWWQEVYEIAFPTLQAMVNVREDGWAQRAGIDRHLFLADGTTLKIDEKVRSEDYPDILLEIWSNRDRQIPGWIEKPLSCDFIAYAFIPSRTCYLLPYQTLRRAWSENKVSWGIKARKREDGFRYVEADNGTYVTVSCAIPLRLLRQALTDAMIVKWTA